MPALVQEQIGVLIETQQLLQDKINNITKEFELALEVGDGINLEEYALSLKQSRARVTRVANILTNLQFKLERLE